MPWALARGFYPVSWWVGFGYHALLFSFLMAASVCDLNGRVIANDSTEGMLRRLDHKELALTLARDLAEIPASLRRYAAELQNPRRLVLRYRMSEAKVSEILSAANAAGLEIVDLTTEEADLEDIFLQLTREPTSTHPGGLRAAGRRRRVR